MEPPDARIRQPTEVLVRVTWANICGSDLHMYEGRTEVERGRSFTIVCGHGENCERQLTGYCLTAQPGPHLAGAARG